MLSPEDTKKRILAAQKILLEPSSSREKFDSLRTLTKGINPKLDKILDTCASSLKEVEKLHQGQLIELTAEHLPEYTEEEKRRKNALLFFIKNWKDLKSEVNRIRAELDVKDGQSNSLHNHALHWGKIIGFAKGPFGIITLAAIIIVTFLIATKSNQPQPSTGVSPLNSPTPSTQIQKAIIFQDKKIPLTELDLRSGPDCRSGNTFFPHYHAKNHTSVRATDGTIIPDPGGCGYGKGSDVQIVDI